MLKLYGLRRPLQGVQATYAALKRILPKARTALTFYYNSDTVNHGWTTNMKPDAGGKLVEYGRNYDLLLSWTSTQCPRHNRIPPR